MSERMSLTVVCCISGITVGETAGVIVEPPVPMNIIADHPFVFFISDDINSVPLFSGWVVSP